MPFRLILRSVTIGAALALSAACHRAPVGLPVPARPVAKALQLVVVTTPSWDTTTGTLRRFERATTSSAWKEVGGGVPVVVGRTGLAWGIGFDGLDTTGEEAHHKREGDGRSPAGVFSLDTLFGFAPLDSAKWARLPYAHLTAESDCVDDVASTHYNTIVDRSAVPRVDWSSAERMRSIAQYRLGVIVGYNASPPIRGRGSCIFLHIWNGPQSATSGCTALDADALMLVAAWLDGRRRPMIVQLPEGEYERMLGRWGLPGVR